MQFFSDETSRYVKANAPQWARYITINARGICHYWSHEPCYMDDNGLFGRLEGKYEGILLPTESIIIEQLDVESNCTKSNKARPSLYLVT